MESIKWQNSLIFPSQVKQPPVSFTQTNWNTIPAAAWPHIGQRKKLLHISAVSWRVHTDVLSKRLIWIKCLKAFQTPGDLNSFGVDLRTKQTIMMQACVKMSTAVVQQMPTLDVFINVLASLFSSVIWTWANVLLQSWNKEKKQVQCEIQAVQSENLFLRWPCKLPNFPRDENGIVYARCNQKRWNVPHSVRITTTLAERCVLFLFLQHDMRKEH